MVQRQLWQVLVYALPISLVTSAIFLGGASLLSSAGDETGAVWFRRLAVFAASILAIDLILLVGLLGAERISQED